MPIEVATEIRVYDQEEFHALDRRVMQVVFAAHNDFGPLMDERSYKSELAARCIEAGLEPVEQELRIRVSHESFTKDYSMDVLVCRGLMIEAKVAEALVAAHRVQALNYLLLTGMRHGRLVNFGTNRVQHEFVSTTLTPSERRRFLVGERKWAATNDGARLVRDKTIDLLADWGGFLDVNLYREALVHFLGGTDRVNQPVEIFSGSRPVAVQRLNLLDAATALAVTASPSESGTMRVNLERLLLHTRLESIQWVNLQRHRVEFTTVTRRGAQRPVDFSHDSVLHDSVPGCFL